MKYKLRSISLWSILLMFCGMWCGRASAVEKWVQTAATDLTSGDVVLIVDQNSSRAMSNDNGSSAAPSATEVMLNSDLSEVISEEVPANLQWVVTVDNSGQATDYLFNVAGTSNYLYCINNNNGLRVGSKNDNKVFNIYDNDGVDFLFNVGQSRYVGVYNNQEWRSKHQRRHMDVVERRHLVRQRERLLQR